MLLVDINVRADPFRRRLAHHRLILATVHSQDGGFVNVEFPGSVDEILNSVGLGCHRAAHTGPFHDWYLLIWLMVPVQYPCRELNCLLLRLFHLMSLRFYQAGKPELQPSHGRG